MKLTGRFQQLGTQLIIFYMVISLVVLSGSSYFIYSFMLGHIKENNETLLLQQFQQLDHNIDGIIEDVDSLSKLFLMDAGVQRFLNYQPEDGEFEYLQMKNDLHKVIESYVSNYDFLDSLYIIGDVQGAVGGTNRTTLVHTAGNWLENFVSSGFYLNALQRFPEMVVQGGIHKTYFNPYIPASSDSTVLSMIRGVRPLYSSETNAVLVLNVDEPYLSSLYSTALQENEGKMYIVDREGIVISSSVKSDIGTTSPYYSRQIDDRKYGSYDGGGNAPVQVVFFKLRYADWYMMKEIPLNQFSEQINSAQTRLVFVIVISLIVIFIVTYFWLKKMIGPLRVLAHKMMDVSRGELGVTFTKIPNNEFGMVIRRFNEMSLSIVELLRNTNEMQEKRRELEIEALQNQINPHFLYNTLNMIRWMAASIKADQIVNSVVALGNILRPAFISKDSMCTLRDELSYLENYIQIINWRFRNSVNFIIEVDEAYLDHRVPRFILQPIIENSIKFGMQDEEREILIHIEVFEEAEHLILMVTDSGIGIDPVKIEQLNNRMKHGDAHADLQSSGNGIGLYNVNKRIQLNYGSPYGLRLVAQPEGTRVIVQLPKQS
ncbi:sensor histidine kinase [Cohnella sp.]|uniref:cache domain-containing sensor histidine kinase n=1 Tax=Cohnella sp. TaxID=1883426 RepID=UPI003569C1D0